jgi:putative molybdopterin biosynthesis protein
MKFKRNVYLKMKTLPEAREILFQAFGDLPPLPAESISVPDAVGRVLAEPVNARISSPNFHLAAMDGLAVKAEITFGASAAAPRELFVDRDAFYVNTGHVLPQDTDAVIMVENVNELDEERVEI